MRYDTPVQRGWRIASEDVELAGQRIGKGQMVLQMIPALPTVIPCTLSNQKPWTSLAVPAVI